MISHFFIDRPIFASVLSIVITIAGLVSIPSLPVAQYPDITPPTVLVTALYPGANSQTVLDTVAAPIEQQVSGVENALYMASQCTNDGNYTLLVTFKPGMDANMAQVLVQNRVSLALPVIPDLVQREGVAVKKISPSTMMIVNLVSDLDPKTGKPVRDSIELSNYAMIQIRDELLRLPGIANVTFMGERDYSMRAWLNPDKMALLGVTSDMVVQALQEQNLQVAAGSIGQQPVPSGQQFQLIINTLGRLVDPEQFGNVIIKVGNEGTVENQSTQVAVVRLKDLGRVELGAQQYDQTCTLDGQSSVALSLFQLPGSNALQTAEGVYAKMTELAKKFPPGIRHRIVYDTTPFIKESIIEVFKTLRDAIVLVAIVVLLFLQNWRATVIPLVAVPVAVIGTFALMSAMGFSLNNLSLFGLVLAIGIVVDDAIVVVENVERWLAEGLSPRDATRKAMEEVTGPVIAVALVLCAVFVPCAFITGITGQFFRQFAITIAVSTVISAFNSLTLSPALAAILLQPHGAKKDLPAKILDFTFGWLFRLFNGFFDLCTGMYTRIVGISLRLSFLVLAVYGGLLYATWWGFAHTPSGFIPQQDKGYLLVNVQLPDSASVQRTEEVMEKLLEISREVEGVDHAVTVAGQSILLGANSPNYGSMNLILKPFEERKGRSSDQIASEIRSLARAKVRDATVGLFGPPAVDGLGNAGGFKVMIEDRGPLGLASLQQASDQVVLEGNRAGGLTGLFTNSRAYTPWIYLDIDRDKCISMGVSLGDLFNSLQAFFGSYYVNNFNEFGRTWQVNVMADAQFRANVDDFRHIKVRNKNGLMVPIGTMVNARESRGPVMLTRYNMYSASAIYGDTLPGTSSGDAVVKMESILSKALPKAMSFEWTELSYMQQQAGSTAMAVFALAVVFVFLVLAAQYESWSLPMAVILVVPMCLLCSIMGVRWSGNDINIFTQIGFVVLVGLASKNAILIVEFAKQQCECGKKPREAVLEACRLRLRPILMTSFAFILGVVPLVVATGAGAEMRRTLGLAVFSGMLGVTIFGIFLTPVFFFVIQRIFGGEPSASTTHETHGSGNPHGH